MLFFLLSVLFFLHPAEILGWAEFNVGEPLESVSVWTFLIIEETIPGSWGIRTGPALGEIPSLHRDASSSISLDGRGDRRGGARSRRVGLPLHVEEVGAHGVHDVVEHGKHLVEIVFFNFFSFFFLSIPTTCRERVF